VNVKNDNAPGDVRKASIKNENAPNPNVNQIAGTRSPVTEDGSINCFAIDSGKQSSKTFTMLKRKDKPGQHVEGSSKPHQPLV
jgi:hypothetical protein